MGRARSSPTGTTRLCGFEAEPRWTIFISSTQTSSMPATNVADPRAKLVRGCPIVMVVQMMALLPAVRCYCPQPGRTQMYRPEQQCSSFATFSLLLSIHYLYTPNHATGLDRHKSAVHRTRPASYALASPVTELMDVDRRHIPTWVPGLMWTVHSSRLVGMLF